MKITGKITLEAASGSLQCAACEQEAVAALVCSDCYQVAHERQDPRWDIEAIRLLVWWYRDADFAEQSADYNTISDELETIADRLAGLPRPAE